MYIYLLYGNPLHFFLLTSNSMDIMSMVVCIGDHLPLLDVFALCGGKTLANKVSQLVCKKSGEEL